MNYRPENSFSMSYASRKIIFPGDHLTKARTITAENVVHLQEELEAIDAKKPQNQQCGWRLLQQR
jgi:membrane protein insertase Oxa1/YidC/SpoIIIJ